MRKFEVFLAIFMTMNLIMMPCVNAINDSVVNKSVVPEALEDSGLEIAVNESEIVQDVERSENLTIEVEGVNESEENETLEFENGTLLVNIEDLVNESFDDIKEEVNESENLTTEVGGVNGSEENEASLVNIEDLVNESFDDSEGEVNESSFEKDGGLREVEMVKERLVKDGKVELEFEVEKGEKVEIKKDEVERGDLDKRVVISSEEHFENELRVYSDLPSPANEEDVAIYWDNEGEKVDFDVEEYNEEGLVTRVSWIVPHLSTQKYRIIIDVGEAGNESDEIILNVSSPINGSTVQNPISFGVSVNYTKVSDIDCWMKIDDVQNGPLFGVGETNISGVELIAGNHNWMVECWDNETESIRGLSSGYFNVAANNLSIEGIDEFYFNDSSVSGSVVSPGGNLEMNLEHNGVNQTVSLLGDSFTIDGENISSEGEYKLYATTDYYEENVSVIVGFEVGSAAIKFRETEADLGDTEYIDFYMGNLAGKGTYLVYVNDSIVGGGDLEDGTKSISFKPDAKGSYTVKAVISGTAGRIVSGENTLTVENGEDDENPDIDLIFPANNEVVDTDKINFEYIASDNVKLLNCSLNIYNASDGFSDELVFPLSAADKNLAKKINPDNNERIKVELIDFDEGEYYWEVECYDNNTNYEWDLNSFEVEYGGNISTASSDSSKSELQEYDRMDEVEEMINAINDFLEKENDFGPEEMDMLKVLGISDKLSTYKKKLVQHDQDLKYNLKYMDNDTREKRIDEIYGEIDGIKDEIPTGISILDSYDYSKASLDVGMEEIINSYMNSTNTEIKKSALKNLVRANEELQSDLGVDVKLRKVKIDMVGGSREMVVVLKSIDLKDDSTKDFLEYLPESLKDKNIVFLTDAEEVGSRVWKFVYEDLDEGQLVYYIEDSVNFGDIEKSETVLFAEDVNVEGLGVTGFAILGGDSLSWWPFIMFLMLFVGYISMVAFGKIKIEAWRRKEPNVARMLDLIKQTKTLVFENDIVTAHEKYRQMKEIYKVLPQKTKKFFYKEIRRVHLTINKKDILNLVKEYDRARREYRREDAALLYQKINEVYKKLPKKYQDKVYQKVVRSSL